MRKPGSFKKIPGFFPPALNSGRNMADCPQGLIALNFACNIWKGQKCRQKNLESLTGSAFTLFHRESCY